MGARITGKKRLAVIKLYGHLCYLCGIECTIYRGQHSGYQRSDALTIDHVQPRSLGGTDALDNLAVACSVCNNIKDDLPLGDEQGLEAMRLRLLYFPAYRTIGLYL